jgi:hypothetical protein
MDSSVEQITGSSHVILEGRRTFQNNRIYLRAPSTTALHLWNYLESLPSKRMICFKLCCFYYIYIFLYPASLAACLPSCLPPLLAASLAACHPSFLPPLLLASFVAHLLCCSPPLLPPLPAASPARLPAPAGDTLLLVAWEVRPRFMICFKLCWFYYKHNNKYTYCNILHRLHLLRGQPAKMSV